MPPRSSDCTAQLTPTEGRVQVQKLRPSVSSAHDLARARGMASSGGNLPSLFPGEPPLYVGGSNHTAVQILKKLGIRAVLNCAPSVCKDPVAEYKAAGIMYEQIDAQDDRNFPLLKECLPAASKFISSAHAEERPILVHCMAGVNRSATLAVAHLLLRDRTPLLALFPKCVEARPSILQNPSFQLQLCALAQRHGLLGPPGGSDAPAAPRAAAPPVAAAARPPDDANAPVPRQTCTDGTNPFQPDDADGREAVAQTTEDLGDALAAEGTEDDGAS